MYICAYYDIYLYICNIYIYIYFIYVPLFIYLPLFRATKAMQNTYIISTRVFTPRTYFNKYGSFSIQYIC